MSDGEVGYVECYGCEHPSHAAYVGQFAGEWQAAGTIRWTLPSGDTFVSMTLGFGGDEEEAIEDARRRGLEPYDGAAGGYVEDITSTPPGMPAIRHPKAADSTRR